MISITKIVNISLQTHMKSANLNNKKTGRKGRKDVLKRQKQQVGMANASMGKFDPVTNEELKHKKVRRRQKISFKSVDEEMKRNRSLIRKLIS